MVDNNNSHTKNVTFKSKDFFRNKTNFRLDLRNDNKSKNLTDLHNYGVCVKYVSPQNFNKTNDDNEALAKDDLIIGINDIFYNDHKRAIKHINKFKAYIRNQLQSEEKLTIQFIKNNYITTYKENHNQRKIRDPYQPETIRERFQNYIKSIPQSEISEISAFFKNFQILDNFFTNDKNQDYSFIYSIVEELDYTKLRLVQQSGGAPLPKWLRESDVKVSTRRLDETKVRIEVLRNNDKKKNLLDTETIALAGMETHGSLNRDVTTGVAIIDMKNAQIDLISVLNRIIPQKTTANEVNENWEVKNARLRVETARLRMETVEMAVAAEAAVKVAEAAKVAKAAKAAKAVEAATKAAEAAKVAKAAKAAKAKAATAIQAAARGRAGRAKAKKKTVLNLDDAIWYIKHFGSGYVDLLAKKIKNSTGIASEDKLTLAKELLKEEATKRLNRAMQSGWFTSVDIPELEKEIEKLKKYVTTETLNAAQQIVDDKKTEEEAARGAEGAEKSRPGRVSPRLTNDAEVAEAEVAGAEVAEAEVAATTLQTEVNKEAVAEPLETNNALPEIENTLKPLTSSIDSKAIDMIKDVERELEKNTKKEETNNALPEIENTLKLLTSSIDSKAIDMINDVGKGLKEDTKKEKTNNTLPEIENTLKLLTSSIKDSDEILDEDLNKVFDEDFKIFLNYFIKITYNLNTTTTNDDKNNILFIESDKNKKFMQSYLTKLYEKINIDFYYTLVDNDKKFAFVPELVLLILKNNLLEKGTTFQSLIGNLDENNKVGDYLANAYTDYNSIKNYLNKTNGIILLQKHLNENFYSKFENERSDIVNNPYLEMILRTIFANKDTYKSGFKNQIKKILEFINNFANVGSLKDELNGILLNTNIEIETTSDTNKSAKISLQATPIINVKIYGTNNSEPFDDDTADSVGEYLKSRFKRLNSKSQTKIKGLINQPEQTDSPTTSQKHESISNPTRIVAHFKSIIELQKKHVVDLDTDKLKKNTFVKHELKKNTFVKHELRNVFFHPQRGFEGYTEQIDLIDKIIDNFENFDIINELQNLINAKLSNTEITIEKSGKITMDGINIPKENDSQDDNQVENFMHMFNDKTKKLSSGHKSNVVTTISD